MYGISRHQGINGTPATKANEDDVLRRRRDDIQDDAGIVGGRVAVAVAAIQRVCGRMVLNAPLVWRTHPRGLIARCSDAGSVGVSVEKRTRPARDVSGIL